MREKILNMFNQVGVMETAKYFGGLSSLTKLVGNDSELLSKINDETSGVWTVLLNNDKSLGSRFIDFDFNIISYDIDDGDDTDSFVYMVVDLHIDFPYLEQHVKDDIIVHLFCCAYELEGDIELRRSNGLSKITHKSIYIKEVNGKPISPRLIQRGENCDTTLTDSKVYKLLKSLPLDEEYHSISLTDKIKKILTDFR